MLIEGQVDCGEAATPVADGYMSLADWERARIERTGDKPYFDPQICELAGTEYVIGYQHKGGPHGCRCGYIATTKFAMSYIPVGDAVLVYGSMAEFEKFLVLIRMA